jgi:LPXTG-site transpeptidase (sortase) family protein
MQVLVNATGEYTNIAEVSAAVEIDPDSTPNNNNPNEDDQSTVVVSPARGGGGGGNPAPAPNNPAAAASFLIPVTGFKANVVTDISHVAKETYTSTGDVMLEIPSLNVKIPIVGVPKKDGTWNVSWLTNEAGWLEGSAFPSWNGNSVLTSHVYLASGLPGPFVNLNKLKYGDTIIVHAYGQKYTFAVQTNEIVSPNDRSVMKHEEKPWLTLITCKDYDEKTRTYKNRVAVRAILVKVEWD